MEHLTSSYDLYRYYPMVDTLLLRYYRQDMCIITFVVKARVVLVPFFKLSSISCYKYLPLMEIIILQTFPKIIPPTSLDIVFKR